MANKIYVKVYEMQQGTMLAMCDEELIGMQLKEGARIMDLKTYSKFYVGEKKSEKEVEEIVSKAKIYSANVVGERAVGVLIKMGIVKEEEVMRIQQVPFVHLYSVS
ncbi:MAG: DUF424 family protein [Candidatus Micrarchaeia archaeon]|jgi:hypothetical protein